MNLSAIILAGGFGTRLKSVVSEVPKPLAPISNLPFLFFLIKYLKQQGVNKIYLSLHHMADQIINAFKDEAGVFFNIELEPLGTGGAILHNLNFIESENIIILNGDSLTTTNIKNMLLFHKQNNSNFTISAVKVENCARFGTLEINENNFITTFYEKKSINEKGFINSGMYIANTKFLLQSLQNINKTSFSIEKEFFENNNNLMAFKNETYFIDIGIPEDYIKAQTEIPQQIKKKALFLDRDGVINYDENQYTHKIEEFEFIEGIFELCKKFQEKGYLIFVVTNQSGIARGYYSVQDFEKLTNYMEDEFSKNGINITKTYFCPYHIEGTVPEFTSESEDRKPNAGMILKASKEFYLDLENSVLIGDKETDIEAGKKAGIKNNILFTGSFKDIKI